MRRRALIVTIAFAVAPAVPLGCTALSGASDLLVAETGAGDEVGVVAPPAADSGSTAPPPDDIADSGTPPVLEIDDSGDAAVYVPFDAGVENLHPDPSFDQGCGTWSPFNSVLSGTPTARSAPKACKVCSASGANPSVTFTADDDGFLSNPPVGAKYHVVLWARAPIGGGTPPSAGVAVHLRTFQESPFKEVDTAGSGSIVLDDFWRKLEATLTVTEANKVLNVYVGSVVEAGTCFLVDDILVERVQ